MVENPGAQSINKVLKEEDDDLESKVGLAKYGVTLADYHGEDQDG